MKDKYRSTDAEQLFTTYGFVNDKNRDIALAEYQNANQSLENKEKFFTSSFSVIALILSIVSATFVNIGIANLVPFIDILKNDQRYIAIAYLFNFFLCLLFILYLAQRQREFCFAARKLIIIRRLMGVSYGKSHMILPTWRVEGADLPYSIKPFSGWFNYVHFPMFLVVAFSTTIFFILSYPVSYFYSSLTAILYACVLLFLYRRSLCDDHENTWFLITKALSKFLKVRLDNNIEYRIYRAKLQNVEEERMDITHDLLIKHTLFLEDKNFFKHKGIDTQAILRAVKLKLVYGRNTGGSTITQQLARSLFIVGIYPIWRRKIIEIFLAKWINSAFEKQDVLFMYLSSVRFEYKVIGIVDAMKYFFDGIIPNPTPAQAFFLVERLSNVNSKLLVDKLSVNILNAFKANLLNNNDVDELIRIFAGQINSNKIKSDKEELQKLKSNLKTKIDKI